MWVSLPAAAFVVPTVEKHLRGQDNNVVSFQNPLEHTFIYSSQNSKPNLTFLQEIFPALWFLFLQCSWNVHGFERFIVFHGSVSPMQLGVEPHFDLKFNNKRLSNTSNPTSGQLHTNSRVTGKMREKQFSLFLYTVQVLKITTEMSLTLKLSSGHNIKRRAGYTVHSCN